MRESDLNNGSREIVIAGGFDFPDGSAGARVTLGIARALRAGGYTVSFISVDQTRMRLEDACPDGLYRYDGFVYRTAGAPQKSAALLPRIRTWLGTGARMTRHLAAMDLGNVRAIIGYGPYFLATRALLRFCRSRHIPLVIIVTEWQAPKYEMHGLLGSRYWEQEVCMRLYYRRVGHVITLSSFLQKHFCRQGCTAVRVPAVNDVDEPALVAARSQPLPSRDALHLLFAGSCKRDRLDIILQSLVELRRNNCPVVLELMGFSKEYLASRVGWELVNAPELNQALIFHGRVPPDQVFSIMALADFGLLLRDQERWADACFPSRLFEYLSLGIPVICNHTSDLAEFIHHGEEGLVVDATPEKERLLGAIRQAAALNRDDRKAMRTRALERARRSLHYTVYIEPLKQFLEPLCNRKAV